MFMGTRQLQKSKSNRHKIRYYDGKNHGNTKYPIITNEI